MTPSAPPCVVSPDLDPIVLPAIERAAARLSHGDEALAEDLAQEGRLGAWRAATVWWAEGGVGLRPWVMTAARQRMYNALRQRLGLAVEALPEEWDVSDEGEGAEHLERIIELRKRLDLLPRRERAVVDLVLGGGRLNGGRSRRLLRRATARRAG